MKMVLQCFYEQLTEPLTHMNSAMQCKTLRAKQTTGTFKHTDM